MAGKATRHVPFVFRAGLPTKSLWSTFSATTSTGTAYSANGCPPRAKPLGRVVTLLQGNVVTLTGCRFIGRTLWTDFALAGDTLELGDDTGEVIYV